MMIRKPVVAGIFYPSDSQELQHVLSDLHKTAREKPGTGMDKDRILGGIVPHAGYQYCGAELACFFHLAGSGVSVADTFVIIHPDHYGVESSMAVDLHDAWETPWAGCRWIWRWVECWVCPELRILIRGALVLRCCSLFFNILFPIVLISSPVSMHEQSIGNARLLGRKLMDIALQLDRRITLLASSDFSHFVVPEKGYYQDGLVIEKICQLDAEGVQDTILNNMTFPYAATAPLWP